MARNMPLHFTSKLFFRTTIFGTPQGRNLGSVPCRSSNIYDDPRESRSCRRCFRTVRTLARHLKQSSGNSPTDSHHENQATRADGTGVESGEEAVQQRLTANTILLTAPARKEERRGLTETGTERTKNAAQKHNKRKPRPEAEGPRADVCSSALPVTGG